MCPFLSPSRVMWWNIAMLPQDLNFIWPAVTSKVPLLFMSSSEQGLLSLRCFVFQGTTIPRLYAACSCFRGNMAVLVMQHMGKPLTKANCNALTLVSTREALQKLHDCNVIHGEARAANCMLAGDGSVCLIDLDTAQHCTDEATKQQEMLGLTKSLRQP